MAEKAYRLNRVRREPVKNKVILITGANSGMGLASSIELAKKGAHVIMLCRSLERGEEAL